MHGCSFCLPLVRQQWDPAANDPFVDSEVTAVAY
jgi:hypothetical protein